VVYANLPAPLFDRHAARFAALGLGVELAVTGPWLDSASPDELEQIARTGGELNLDFILHGPFLGLDPGATDSMILDASRRRLRQAVDVAARLNATSIVFHTGYTPFTREVIDPEWVAIQRATWQGLLQYAPAYLEVHLENVREPSWRPLLAILEAVASPRLKLCWDIGHFNLFGGGDYRTWAAQAVPHLGEMHLHNNHGEDDDHFALDDGTAPAGAMLDALISHNCKPKLTIEHYDEDRLARSLRFLQPYLAPLGAA
jgi:sugar phosphate isomerase/epimerase